MHDEDDDDDDDDDADVDALLPYEAYLPDAPLSVPCTCNYTNEGSP